MDQSIWSALKPADYINFLILIVTAIAVLVGPIAAVKITLGHEARRAEQAWMREVLAALMRTRRMYMHTDHVSALNLVQLVFHRRTEVLQAHRAYMQNLNEEVPQGGPALDHFLERRGDLFFDLLYAICASVGCNIDKRDLERLAYLPVGWDNNEQQARTYRQAVLDLLNGRRPLPIAQFAADGTPGMFPPPPK